MKNIDITFLLGDNGDEVIMNLRVTEVKPMSGYKLELIFSNGEKGLYDGSHLLDWCF